MLMIGAPRRTRIAVVALVVTAVALVGIIGAGVALRQRGSESISRLYFPPDAGFGMALPYSSNPAPWAFGSVPLCVTSPGTVTITRLVPLGASGIVAVDWATRLHTGNTFFGDGQQSLASAGFSKPAVVEAVCSSGERYELGAAFSRTAAGDGRFTSLRIDYVSAGKSESLTLPWRMKLCGPAGKTVETCGQP